MDGIFLLLSKDDDLPTVAAVTVVETKQQLEKKRARRGEKQGAGQSWAPLLFGDVQGHVQVDQGV